MHYFVRFLSILLVTTTAAGNIRAATTAPKEAEYRRMNTNYYWKSDIVNVYPSAVILPADSFTQKGDSYLITPKKRAPKVLYMQVMSDWIEPITPPDMPTSLNIAPDAMQIREPQGDVQVALPSAPASYIPAAEGLILPNGSVVKTGADGTAAVLFGGVNSARLIPNSEAAVQQTVEPLARTTEIDLTKGAVFSKVGKQEGVTQDYRVHTPFGVAAARGTDFVTVAMQARTDVWIAQGTVALDQTDGQPVGSVSADGSGPLKIVRYPAMGTPGQTMLADSETMTAALNFIPIANQKVKALRDKLASGETLTGAEHDYLQRIKEVPCLIKLALVEPPPPPPPPVPVPIPAVPAVPASAPPVTASTISAPVTIYLHPDGNVDLSGSTMSLTELKWRLVALGKKQPGQTVVLAGQQKATPDQLKSVKAICHSAKLKILKQGDVPSAHSMPAPEAMTPGNNLPAASLLMDPSTETMSSNAPPVNPSSPDSAPSDNLPTNNTNSPATTTP
jgi:hypothetical protein